MSSKSRAHEPNAFRLNLKLDSSRNPEIPCIARNHEAVRARYCRTFPAISSGKHQIKRHLPLLSTPLTQPKEHPSAPRTCDLVVCAVCTHSRREYIRFILSEENNDSVTTLAGGAAAYRETVEPEFHWRHEAKSRPATRKEVGTMPT